MDTWMNGGAIEREKSWAKQIWSQNARWQREPMFAQAFESDQRLNGDTGISDRSSLSAIAVADGGTSSTTVDGSTAVAAIAIKWTSRSVVLYTVLCLELLDRF